MKEFGPTGKYKDVRSEGRRALFSDIARVINDSKASSGFTTVATLDSAQYRDAFNGITEFSVYGACFNTIVMMHGVIAEMEGYADPIAYVLDEGNEFKHDILEAHAFMRNNERNVGTLAFDSDNRLAALQAADVVAWAARRRLASELKSGFEPLAAIFENGRHVEVPYKREWMIAVAGGLRAQMTS